MRWWTTGNIACCVRTRRVLIPFLLKASRETPRRLKHERRGTIGLRVPDHPVTAMLLTELGEPVMSSTLLLPGEELPRTDAKEIYERLEHRVDLVLDGGNCGLVPTSVIDLSGDRAVVVRVGRGDVAPFAGARNRIMLAQCGRQELVFFTK